MSRNYCCWPAVLEASQSPRVVRSVGTAIAKEAHTRVCAGDEERMNEGPSDTASKMANG